MPTRGIAVIVCYTHVGASIACHSYVGASVGASRMAYEALFSSGSQAVAPAGIPAQTTSANSISKARGRGLALASSGCQRDCRMLAGYLHDRRASVCDVAARAPHALPVSLPVHAHRQNTNTRAQKAIQPASGPRSTGDSATRHPHMRGRLCARAPSLTRSAGRMRPIGAPKGKGKGAKRKDGTDNKLHTAMAQPCSPSPAPPPSADHGTRES